MKVSSCRIPFCRRNAGITSSSKMCLVSAAESGLMLMITRRVNIPSSSLAKPARGRQTPGREEGTRMSDPCAGQSMIGGCLKTVGKAEADTGFTPWQRVVCWKPQTAQEGGCWPDPGVESSKELLSYIYHAVGYPSVRQDTYRLCGTPSTSDMTGDDERILPSSPVMSESLFSQNLTRRRGSRPARS